MSDAQSKLIEKALKDPAFRARLVADPKAAVEKELGRKLPDGVSVRVLEDSPQTVHLVLPAALPKGQLDDAELESVAGGLGAAPTFVCGGATWTQYRVC